MYCVKCGKELPESAQFCPNCGTSISSPTTPPPPQPSSSEQQANPSTVQQSVPSVSTPSTPPLPEEKLQCPRCGTDGCIPQYKQHVSGGGYGCLSGCLGWLLLGPLGLLCGACGNSVQSKNELVWICPKCGNEFKKPPTKEQAMLEYAMSFISLGCSMLWASLAGYFMPPEGDKFATFLLLLLGGLAVLFGSLGGRMLYKNLQFYPYSSLTEDEQKRFKTGAIVAGVIFGIFSLLMLCIQS